MTGRRVNSEYEKAANRDFRKFSSRQFSSSTDASTRAELFATVARP